MKLALNYASLLTFQASRTQPTFGTFPLQKRFTTETRSRGSPVQDPCRYFCVGLMGIAHTARKPVWWDRNLECARRRHADRHAPG